MLGPLFVFLVCSRRKKQLFWLLLGCFSCLIIHGQFTVICVKNTKIDCL